MNSYSLPVIRSSNVSIPDKIWEELGEKNKQGNEINRALCAHPLSESVGYAFTQSHYWRARPQWLILRADLSNLTVPASFHKDP